MITPTQPSKNSTTLSLEEKDNSLTWDGSDPMTWDEAETPWDATGRYITKETKNSVSLTLDSKI